MSKQYKRKRRTVALVPVPGPRGTTMNLSISAVAGATGYVIYGIAPLPVRLGADESVRVEPTANGYNLFRLDG